jgi:hypothetical protein
MYKHNQFSQLLRNVVSYSRKENELQIFEKTGNKGHGIMITLVIYTCVRTVL